MIEALKKQISEDTTSLKEATAIRGKLNGWGPGRPLEQMKCSNQLENMMINMIIKMVINQS